LLNEIAGSAKLQRAVFFDIATTHRRLAAKRIAMPFQSG
jgi:hypothetical protein